MLLRTTGSYIRLRDEVGAVVFHAVLDAANCARMSSFLDEIKLQAARNSHSDDANSQRPAHEKAPHLQLADNKIAHHASSVNSPRLPCVANTCSVGFRAKAWRRASMRRTNVL
ncbi:MAG: hypothetical protein EA406_00255 [Rhodospirillales bacterium]|nr:MAG: hypothetical protein EA406_00255 [Rhodospirillales bacterium]